MKQSRQKRFHSDRRKAKKEACTDTCDCADWLRKNLSYPEHEPPTPEERKVLEERVTNGDQKARKEIFNSSLRFLFDAAGESAGGDPDLLMELFQDEALWVIKGLKNWEPGKGSFLTYENYNIKGAKNRYFKKNGYRSYKAKGNNDVDSGSADKEEQEVADEDEISFISSEHKFTFHDIKEDEISDPGSNPEEEVVASRMMLEFIEVRDGLLECMRFYFSQINDIRLRRFSLAILDHDDFFDCILPRLLGKKVKGSNFAQDFINPCRRFLEEEMGEEARRLSDSDVGRKFTNTLSYICRRYLYSNLLQDEKARSLIMRIKELMER